MKPFFIRSLTFATLALLFLTVCEYASASEPQVWTVNSRSEVMRGDARGVTISEDGTIGLSPKLSEIFKTDQPFVWASIVDAGGNTYLGTGGEGKIFKVDAAGKSSVVADIDELNVTALALGRSGELFAGTSPDGKVYRIVGSTIEVYFEPKEKYIWALEMLPGGLAVATGDQGKIYKVTSPNAAPANSLLFDSTETNVISLAVAAGGELVAGTDPGGLVIRFDGTGRAFGLIDSPLREVHDLAVGADGSIYVLTLGDSVSTPKTEATPTAADPRVLTVERPAIVAEAPPKSRFDLTGVRSAIYRIFPDGGSDIVWTSPSVSAFSIHSSPDFGGLLIGTADRGRVLRVDANGRETLLLQTGAGQISTIRHAAGGVMATSSNQGSLFRIVKDPISDGTYESPVLDAKNPSAWGRIWWRASGAVSISTRSGNSDRPNETWSEWSPPSTVASGSPVTSPKARYFQWKAELRSGTVPAELREVNVSFIAGNIAPEVLSINVLPYNVGLVPNPPIQIDPNIQLAGMDPVAFGLPSVTVPPRKVYQRGAVSLQWSAEDRNGDKLIFDVSYKEVGDAAFKPLRTGLSETFLTIDGQALADGKYLFRIDARDILSNSGGAGLSGERTTAAIEIDNTPPTVTPLAPKLAGSNIRFVFEATEPSSFINRAQYSVNGGEWSNIYSEDGISDSRHERFVVEIPATAGDHVVILRAFDVNGNSGTARAVGRR